MESQDGTEPVCEELNHGNLEFLTCNDNVANKIRKKEVDDNECVLQWRSKVIGVECVNRDDRT